jgi:hypothetical protein
MLSYLLTFCAALWIQLFHAYPLSSHRQHEMWIITKDILSTDATPLEALKLENIVALESGWERSAIGSHGEVGAFQLWVFPGTKPEQVAEWKQHGAKEALRRLRVQGIQGYCGCTEPITQKCADLMTHRTEHALLYFWAFDPPANDNGVLQRTASL